MNTEKYRKFLDGLNNLKGRPALPGERGSEWYFGVRAEAAGPPQQGGRVVTSPLGSLAGRWLSTRCPEEVSDLWTSGEIGGALPPAPQTLSFPGQERSALCPVPAALVWHERADPAEASQTVPPVHRPTPS